MIHLSHLRCLSAFMCVFLLAGSISAQSFVNPLPIPYLINSDTIRLRVDTMGHNFNPHGTDSMNVEVMAFAYNHIDSSSNTYLGPSLVWSYQHDIYTEVKNNLPRTTTTHWHGAHVPPFCDGNPHQRIAAGTTWKINFEVLDRSATMWYHPHVMDHTYEQVQMGMSGMLYVEDPPDGDDDSILVALHGLLPHTYGVDDFPIIVQTKKFFRDTADGKIKIDSSCCGSPPLGSGQGYKRDYYYLVNGVMSPYIEFPAQIVRLRVLNGDAKFTFNLGIADPNFAPETFELIATDAGYTDSTYQKATILMAPGGRTEWLLDLRGRKGDTLYLINQVSTMPPRIIGDSSTTGGYAKDTTLLRIVVGDTTANPSPDLTFPMALHPIPPHPAVSHTRTKRFARNGTGPNAPYLINGKAMDITFINDTIMLDSTEQWTLINASNIAHPFHIHDIHFWITEIKDQNGSLIPPDSMPELFSGPLDNVLVRPGWELKFVATFDDFGGPIHVDSAYMTHCHILPHEDRGMMGQFVVWDGQTLSLEDFGKARPMHLYPNPTDGQLYLDGASKMKSRIRIFDVQGRLLRTHSLSPFDGTVGISLNGLGQGLLFVEWTTREGRFIDKVLLE